MVAWGWAPISHIATPQAVVCFLVYLLFEFHMATYGFIWEVLCVHNETTEYVNNDMSNHHPTMSLVELSNMCLTFVQSFRRTLKVIAQRNEACTHALQLAYLLLHVVALVLKHGI